MKKRVAVYVRVSTAKQALNDISIPDQVKQATEYCQKKNWELIHTYIEPGASGRSDKRPVFQRMISDACSQSSPYDIILVHSLSRFFRNPIDQGLYKRQLEEHDVFLRSITQHFGDGAQADLIQTVIAACDAHTSAETAKHVSRSMIENARQGFWNGSRPPLGYCTYVAEQRGDKAKKKLAAEPKGADLVKLIFKLYLHGNGQSGPMGIKLIAEYLNQRGFTTQTGKAFYTSTVSDILKRTAYMGVHYFNKRDSRNGKIKPRTEWVSFETPLIISPEIFETVQQQLKAHSPKKKAPRLVRSSVLLSNIARCETCGSNLMLTTGKSGKYRYYSCANKHLKGGCFCDTPTRIPETKLDEIVTRAISLKVLEPERLKVLFKETLERASNNNQDALGDLKLLRKELREVDSKVAKLFDALTDGQVSDSKGFRDHQNKLEAKREELMRLISLKERVLCLPVSRITNRQIERFSTALQDMLEKGPKQFRKAYMRLLVSNIDVGKKEIRITGSKAALASAVQANKSLNMKVPSFDRKWCTRQDSNL